MAEVKERAMSENSFHPGVFLQELLIWKQVEPAELAAETGIDETDIVDITQQRRDLDENLSRNLAAYFGNSARFWMHLQQSYDQKSA